MVAKKWFGEKYEEITRNCVAGHDWTRWWWQSPRRGGRWRPCSARKPSSLLRVLILAVFFCLLKGLGHHMNIFLRSIKLDQYFPYMRQWFLKNFLACGRKYIKKRFCLLLWKRLRINNWTCTESRRRILPGLPSLSLVGFLHVITSHWTVVKVSLNIQYTCHGRFMEQF